MRLLIVDDHQIVREGVRVLAEQIGGVEVVGEAASGVEALELARTLAPDVALVDIDMPEMDGVETIRRLSEEAPGVRALVLTVHTAGDRIYEAVEAGASGFVPKSASSEEIRAALSALGAGGAYVAPEAVSKAMGALVRRAHALNRPSRGATATRREREILSGLVRGWSSRRIASHLGIGERTVNTHIGHVYRRLGVRNRVDAIREAIRVGLVDGPV